MYHKLVIVGREGVDKSALTIQLIQNNFKYEYGPIEDSFRHEVTIDAEPCLLDIFESSTQEKYSVRKQGSWDPQLFSEWQSQCIRDAEGFLCVYAINCRSSFDEIASLRSKLLLVKYTFPMVLVGNKCDLEEEERQVIVPTET